MSQSFLAKTKNTTTVHTWLLQDTLNLEREKEELYKAQNQLKKEQKELECAMKGYLLEKKMSEEWLRSQQIIFDEKWRILEAEIMNLANEKTRLFDKQNSKIASHTIDAKATNFFRGITNILALKKRYKDLIKIYHPDNQGGDTVTIQEINTQYRKLQQEM